MQILRFLLLLIFLLALALRLIFLFEVRGAPFHENLVADSMYYHDWALEIASGNWLGTTVYWVDPFYAYLLALFYLIGGAGQMAPLIFQAFLGAGTCVLVFFIGRRTFDERTGLLAALLAAGSDPLICHDGVLLKTTLITVLRCLTLLAMLRAGERKTWPTWLLGGFLLGICCLCRSSCLVLVPCVLLWAFSLNWRNERFGPWPRLAVFCLGTAAAILPVTFRNVHVSGDFVLLTANLGQNLYLGNNPYNKTGPYTAPPFIREESEKEEIDWRRYAEKKRQRKLAPSEVSRFWLEDTLDWIAREPGAFFGLLWKKFRLNWNHFEVPDNYDVYFYRNYSTLLKLPLPGFYWVAPFAMLGLFLAALNWRKRLLLYLFLACLSAIPVVFFVFARFRVPYAPFLCLFAAYAVREWIRGVRTGQFYLFGGGGGIVFFASLFVFQSIPHMDPSLSIKPYMNLGTICRDRGAYEESEQWYKKALEVKPEAAIIHNLLGLLYLRQYREEDALAAFLRAAALDPRERYAHRNLALLYWKRGEYERALSAFRSDLAVNPKRKPEFLVWQAIYHINREEYQAARASLKETL